MDVKELLEKSSQLPNVPDVVRELIQQMNDPNARYDLIAEKVGHDQTLSLKILRLVNSAHFGLCRKISSIDEAVVMLGMARLKTMVIASGLVGSARHVEGLDLKKFWAEAFQIATIARWFAERQKAEKPDIAFTAGLIHNIGQLLLHLTKPMLAQAIQARVESSEASRSEAEMERLGFTTPEAGEALLRMWKLPKDICDATGQYKKPLSFEPVSQLAIIINLACVVNSAIKNKQALDALQAEFPMEIAKAGGFEESILDALGEAMNLESGMEALLE